MQPVHDDHSLSQIGTPGKDSLVHQTVLQTKVSDHLQTLGDSSYQVIPATQNVPNLPNLDQKPSTPTDRSQVASFLGRLKGFSGGASRFGRNILEQRLHRKYPGHDIIAT